MASIMISPPSSIHSVSAPLTAADRVPVDPGDGELLHIAEVVWAELDGRRRAC
jgi:hypothetical protein